MVSDLDSILDKYEKSQDAMLSNIAGLPLLACRIAQIGKIISNNPVIKTDRQASEFVIADLISYSAALKADNCIAYMFIDKYIENLKECSSENNQIHRG